MSKIDKIEIYLLKKPPKWIARILYPGFICNHSECCLINQKWRIHIGVCVVQNLPHQVWEPTTFDCIERKNGQACDECMGRGAYKDSGSIMAVFGDHGKLTGNIPPDMSVSKLQWG